MAWLFRGAIGGIKPERERLVSKEEDDGEMWVEFPRVMPLYGAFSSLFFIGKGNSLSVLH